MNKTKNDSLLNYCNSLKKIPCIIESFSIHKNEIANSLGINTSGAYIQIICNIEGGTVGWSLPLLTLNRLMEMFGEHDWSRMKNKYCYLYYTDNDYFRGIRQFEPNGNYCLFFQDEKNGFSWYTGYVGFYKDFKQILKGK